MCAREGCGYNVVTAEWDPGESASCILEECWPFVEAASQNQDCIQGFHNFVSHTHFMENILRSSREDMLYQESSNTLTINLSV